MEGIVQNEEISCLYSDSDDEFDLKNWSSNVSTEILDKLSSKEKKRQEIINELYHTEKSHIRGNTFTNRTLQLLNFCLYDSLQS